jgi:NTE family protein
MRSKVVTLALQGGGSHGAFAWGVLDRLLDDERIQIKAIGGASAGAINATLLAYGLTVGGRDGAREALTDFWERVARSTPLPFLPDTATGPVTLASSVALNPALRSLLFLTRLFSPYQLNPLDLNPLRDILVRQIDFERLRRECQIELFIAATRVSVGRPRLFRTRELTLDMLLASACIPTFHHAIEIDGESYWDGGLSANPPILPLVHQNTTTDILVVLVSPCRRAETPATADEIGHRLAEISFGSSAFAELQGLALAKREAERSLIPFGRLERRLRRLNLHLIASEEFMSRLHALSKLNAYPAFLYALRDEGRRRTDAWLTENFRLIGVRSSFDLAQCLNIEVDTGDARTAA